MARNGPTVFSIKDEENVVHRVVLGSPHTCSCCATSSGSNTQLELCVHQLFCILKVLKVPDTHPLAYQVGFTDNETDQVLSGACNSSNSRQGRRDVNSKKGKNTEVSDSNFVSRQELSDEMELSCPICQDDLKLSQALTWCRKGCGNNIHANCMQTYAQYKVSNRESVACPLCREDWAIELLRDDCKGKSSLKNSCVPISCCKCRTQIKTGLYYRCIECSNESIVIRRATEDFCEICYSNIGIDHAQHHFLSSDASIKVATDVHWQPAVNPRAGAAPLVNTDVLRALQERELTNDDYELLLNLDHNGPRDFPSHLTNALPVCSNATVKYCWCKCDSNSLLNATSIYRVLPCKHVAHDKCIQQSILRATVDRNCGVAALTCSHHQCKSRIFPGLIRKRKTKKPNTEDSKQTAPATNAATSLAGLRSHRDPASNTEVRADLSQIIVQGVNTAVTSTSVLASHTNTPLGVVRNQKMQRSVRTSDTPAGSSTSRLTDVDGLTGTCIGAGGIVVSRMHNPKGVNRIGLQLNNSIKLAKTIRRKEQSKPQAYGESFVPDISVLTLQRNNSSSADTAAPPSSLTISRSRTASGNEFRYVLS